MGDKPNGTKLYLWIFSVIIFPVLFYMGNNIIANEKTRQEESKEIRSMIKGEDDTLRKDFLEAVNKLGDKIVLNNEKISCKLEGIISDIAVLKSEVKKR